MFRDVRNLTVEFQKLLRYYTGLAINSPNWIIQIYTFFNVLELYKFNCHYYLSKMKEQYCKICRYDSDIVCLYDASEKMRTGTGTTYNYF